VCGGRTLFKFKISGEHQVAKREPKKSFRGSRMADTLRRPSKPKILEEITLSKV